MPSGLYINLCNMLKDLLPGFKGEYVMCNWDDRFGQIVMSWSYVDSD